MTIKCRAPNPRHAKLAGAVFSDLESRILFESIMFYDRFEQYFKNRTRLVGVGKLDAVSSCEDAYCVGTKFLSSCAGVAVFDRQAKVAGVAHIFLKSTLEEDFSSFAPFSNRLVECVGTIGGRLFEFHAFNVLYGHRPEDQNRRLTAIVEMTAEDLRRKGLITTLEFHHERDFLIDSRTGEIFVGLGPTG